MDLAGTLERLRAVAGDAPGLRLLVLFGSRARGDAHDRSDLDLAFEATPGFDVDDLRAALVSALGTERIDLVDLERAGALLRFQAARDGIPIVERPPGRFVELQEVAARTWCELEPVLRRAHADVLAGLGP